MPIPGQLGLDLLVAAGRVVHGDRIPYPPRRRHSPAGLLRIHYISSMAVPPGDDPAGAGLGMLPAGRVTGPALRGLSRFAGTRGLPAGRESWLDYDVIEAFCVAGLAGRAPGTRGTYRPALYRLAEAAHGPAGRRATPFAAPRRPAPYSPAVRAELAALAAAERDPAQNGPPHWRWSCSGSGRGCVPASWWRCAAMTSPATAARSRFTSPGRPRGRCRSPPATPAGPGSWPAAPATGSCSGPARLSAAIRTSSTASPGTCPPTRPRPACL